MVHTPIKTTYKLGNKTIAAKKLGRPTFIDGVARITHRHRFPDGRFVVIMAGSIVPTQNIDGTVERHDPTCVLEPDGGCDYSWWDEYQLWDDKIVMP